MLEADYRNIDQGTFIPDPNHHGLQNISVDVPALVRPFLNHMIAHVVNELQVNATRDFARAYAYNLTCKNRMYNKHFISILVTAADEMVYLMTAYRQDPAVAAATACKNAVNTFVAVHALRNGNEELKNQLPPTLAKQLFDIYQQSMTLFSKIEQMKAMNNQAVAPAQAAYPADQFGNPYAVNQQNQFLTTTDGARIVLSPTKTMCVCDAQGRLWSLDSNYRPAGLYSQQNTVAVSAPVSTVVVGGNNQPAVAPVSNGQGDQLYGNRTIDLRAMRGETPIQATTTPVTAPAVSPQSSSSSLVESITFGGSAPVVVQNTDYLAYNKGANSMNIFVDQNATPDAPVSDSELNLSFIAGSQLKRTRTELLAYSVAYDPTTHVGQYLVSEGGTVQELVRPIDQVFVKGEDVTNMDYYRHELNAMARREQKQYENSLKPVGTEISNRAWELLAEQQVSLEPVPVSDADVSEVESENSDSVKLEKMVAGSVYIGSVSSGNLMNSVGIAELELFEKNLNVMDTTFSYHRRDIVGFIVDGANIQDHLKSAERLLECESLEDLAFALRHTREKVYPRIWHYLNDRAKEVINHALAVNLGTTVVIDDFSEDYLALPKWLEENRGKLVSRALTNHDYQLMKQIKSEVVKDTLSDTVSYQLTTTDYITRIPVSSGMLGLVMHEDTTAVLSTITPKAHAALKTVLSRGGSGTRCYIVTLDNYILEVSEGWLVEGGVLIHKMM